MLDLRAKLQKKQEKSDKVLFFYSFLGYPIDLCNRLFNRLFDTFSVGTGCANAIVILVILLSNPLFLYLLLAWDDRKSYICRQNRHSS